MNSKRPIKSVACVGEVMIELIAHADNSASLGVAGDTYNTAVYLRRILAERGISVAYATALGTDPYSERIMDAIRLHGLGTETIERRDGMMPGLYAIDTDSSGERSFSYWRSSSAARTLFSEPCNITLDRLDQFDLVFLSGITMAIVPPDIRVKIIEWAGRFCSSGGTLAYDSNHRPRLWENPEVAREVNAAMWSIADIALPSVDDEVALFQDVDEASVVKRLRGLGATKGALKRGAEGPRNLEDDAVLVGVSRIEKIVDSTAAGDSFNAGYLSAIALGFANKDAMQQGHSLASRVIQKRGAIVDT